MSPCEEDRLCRWSLARWGGFLRSGYYMPMPVDSAKLAIAGYGVVAEFLQGHDVVTASRWVAGLPRERAGTRRLIDLPWCAELGRRIARDEQLRALLPANAVAVQCTLFAKSPTRNWLVALHQDLSIPVAERIEAVECSGWSEKAGEIFVQPPAAVLEHMMAVRLHLDDCDERNGALRVVPGSHRLGRLSAEGARKARASNGEASVEVPRGGIMLMRPLLLHASSKCSSDRPRRVLHFVFGPPEVPHGLRWRTPVS
jgi:hypothetical protein